MNSDGCPNEAGFSNRCTFASDYSVPMTGALSEEGDSITFTHDKPRMKEDIKGKYGLCNIDTFGLTGETYMSSLILVRQKGP